MGSSPTLSGGGSAAFVAIVSASSRPTGLSVEPVGLASPHTGQPDPDAVQVSPARDSHLWPLGQVSQVRFIGVFSPDATARDTLMPANRNSPASALQASAWKR